MQRAGNGFFILKIYSYFIRVKVFRKQNKDMILLLWKCG